MQELKQRIQSLNDRERQFLGWGVVGALAILAYAFVWQPWQEELDRLRTGLPIKQETLAWMREQAVKIGPLVRQIEARKQTDAEPLLTVIERSAQQSAIDGNIRRMALDEEQRVNIWLTDVDFNRWVVWLERLRSIGVEVNTAVVSRSRGNTVTARVTLQR